MYRCTISRKDQELDALGVINILIPLNSVHTANMCQTKKKYYFQLLSLMNKKDCHIKEEDLKQEILLLFKTIFMIVLSDSWENTLAMMYLMNIWKGLKWMILNTKIKIKIPFLRIKSTDQVKPCHCNKYNKYNSNYYRINLKIQITYLNRGTMKYN